MPDPAGPEKVLEVEGLRKRLGRVMAVDGLDLAVERGQVVGLAGPNGSGKTVTLKAVLGLVRPTAGRIELFGEPVRPGCRQLARVGALVDGPGFVPHLSGGENLRLAWRVTGRPAEEAGFEEALELAGLGRAIDRRFETYSHGMRYRLGLAQALLGRPDLVLLDEPTTGLDPGHIREVRQAIGAVHRAGATVVLSSHLMSEVELVCSHAVVMQSGRRVAAGAVGELLAGTEEVWLEVDDAGRATEILKATSGVARVELEPAGGRAPGRTPWRGLRAEGTELRPGSLFSILAQAGVQVRAFRSGRTLEEVYLDLVGDRPVDA